jgi:flagellar hook-associated protein 2
MQLINLGSFQTTNGRTTASKGLASNLDTKELIDSLVKIKSIGLNDLQDEVTIDNSKISAYSQLTNYMTSYQNAANSLRNVIGYDTAQYNAFQARQVSLTSNDSNIAANYMGVSVAAGAQITNYQVTIQNIAQAEMQNTNSFSSNTSNITQASGGTTAGEFCAGTFQLNGTDITFEEGDSLVEIVSAINAVTNETNVMASIIEISDTDYTLVLQSTLTGSSNGITITDPSGVFSNITLTTMQPGNDANFTVNGFAITRSSNVIDDVVSDVTFTLYQPTVSGQVLTAEVENDISFAQTAIQNFFSAYNDLITFLAEQEERDSNGRLLDTAILGNEYTIRGLRSNLESFLNTLVAGCSVSLGSIGILFTTQPATDTTPEVSNLVELNANTLQTALLDNFNQVAELFQFEFFTSNNTLGVTSRSNNIQINNFTVTVDTSLAAGEQVEITYNDPSGGGTINFYPEYEILSYGGISITGTGVIAGLDLLYTGSGNDIITVNYTQGIADRTYNFLENYTQSNGLIDIAVENLEKSITSINEDIEDQQTKIEDYRKSLTKKYARLEEQIAKANNLSMLLEAQYMLDKN